MRNWTLLILAFALVTNTFADDPEPLSIGQEAPDFELTGVDDKIYTLDDFSGSEVLVVIFTANHCPTAQAYEERMKELAAAYTAEQVQLVAVSSNYPEAVALEEMGYSDLGDSFEEMKIRAEDMDYNFPYLYDGDSQEMAREYGAIATPHVFIFDGDRKLRYSGRIDEMEDPYQEPRQHDARNAIDALLEGSPVPVEETRAFGCSIKWKSKMEWTRKLDADWAARPVSLETLDEEGLSSLLNPGDKVRLINFWATWCGPCIIEFPEFVTMQRMYSRRSFEVVSVSMDRPGKATEVKTFLEETGAAFDNYLADPEDRDAFIGAVDPSWQGNLPYTLLIRPGGEVVYRHDGIIDPLVVRRAIMDQIGRYFADNP